MRKKDSDKIVEDLREIIKGKLLDNFKSQMIRFSISFLVLQIIF